MTISRCIHVATNGILSFFVTTEEYFIVCVYVCIHLVFFIHSPVSGRLGFCHVLAIVNSATVNAGARVHFSDCGFLRVYDQVAGLLGHIVVLSLVQRCSCLLQRG